MPVAPKVQALMDGIYLVDRTRQTITTLTFGGGTDATKVGPDLRNS